jgi:DNA polymerase II small subunit/DNA polymerase delta subunit B
MITLHFESFEQMAQAFKDVKVILNKSKEPLKKAEAVKEATDEKAEAVKEATDEIEEVEEVEEVETLEDAEGAAKKITIEQIREAFVSKNTKGNTQKLKALLNEFGVKKVTDLKEKDFPAVLKELEGL